MNCTDFNGRLSMNLFSQDCFLRIKELANYPAKPVNTHIYKSGSNKGKTKNSKARPASKGLIGVSDKTIWQWVKDGKFPSPIKLSSNVTVWRASDIQTWSNQKSQGLNHESTNP